MLDCQFVIHVLPSRQNTLRDSGILVFQRVYNTLLQARASKGKYRAGRVMIDTTNRILSNLNLLIARVDPAIYFGYVAWCLSWPVPLEGMIKNQMEYTSVFSIK